ncbi:MULTISPECIES: DUF1801 domain-containing protein [unclassified Sphingomonas]|uniref:DUF1801 domain-containing protein n=1 Tax=unclassified Sphingomonas TaxID=196159 RepID=UPI0009E8C544|nr:MULTISPECIES: DUF1801 domain-containing protein [unclassified Sphingomonas]
MKSDPHIDGYIDRAAPFARPILADLRDLVGKNCPYAEETIQSGFPHFVNRGRILCGRAAFKAHVASGFRQNRRETRSKRIGTTIAQLEEGKRLDWKYERC